MVNSECAICLETFKDKKLELFCGHCFHSDCISKLLETDTPWSERCPLCKIPILPQDDEFAKFLDSKDVQVLIVITRILQTLIQTAQL